MPTHSHGLPGAVIGVLAVGFTVAAMLLLLQLADIGSATAAVGAPAYAPLTEGHSYPGPTATPTPLPDLIADKLEVTQAIQDLNNSVRLVQDKPTFVRFHVHSASGVHATNARLTAQRGGVTQELAPLNLGGAIDVRPAPDRSASDHSFLFELPNGFKAGVVTLTARVNPEGAPSETNNANNQIETTVTFEAVPAVNLVAYTVSYRIDSTTFAPADNHRAQLVDWLHRAYPLSELNVWERSFNYGPGLASAQGDLVTPSCGDINATLILGKLLDLIYGASDMPAGAHYYGLVSDNGGDQFMRGCAMGIPHAVATGPAGAANWGWDFDGSYADWYGGHELAHTYGRAHAEFCNALGGNTYPYLDGRISPVLTGDAALYGFDIGNQAIYGPQWKDVMTYCSSQWISDFTYEALMNFFQTNPVPANGLLSEPAGDRLLVGGTIDPNTNAVVLQPILRLPNRTEVTSRVSGPYAIVLRNASGQELVRYPFTPAAAAGGQTTAPGSGEREIAFLIINELVPYVTGTARLDILGPGEQVLIAVMPGGTAPQVTLTEPNGQRSLDGGPVQVAWTASDPDGDELFFAVQYSNDGGQNWTVVAQNVREQSVMVDQTNLPASNFARFRVWATDGLNSSYDDSLEDAVMLNHAPEVEISAPANGATFAAAQTVALAGNGYDIDTGSLSGEQLQWASNRDGVLGTGAHLSTATLTVGDHTVTLAADDGQGGNDQASVQITILGSFAEHPTANGLAVGPQLVALDPSHGVSSAQVAIDNQHAGTTIPWNAAATVPWLQLSKGSGATPDKLGISYVKTGLAQGVYEGAVDFTSSAAPGQRVRLMVALTVQDAKMHLPLVGR